MAKLCRVALLALCVMSLFAGTAAWAAESGTVANPAIGAESPLLFTPAPDLKIGGCRIRCLGTYTTAIGGGPSDWGMGSSCAVAEPALTNALYARADDYCWNNGFDGACSVVQVTTSACYFNGTMFQTDGYANFKCSSTICIDPYQ